MATGSYYGVTKKTILDELKNKKDKDELERWCKNSYSQNYYTIFGQHPKSEKLKTLTKKICLKTLA